MAVRAPIAGWSGVTASMTAPAPPVGWSCGALDDQDFYVTILQPTCRPLGAAHYPAGGPAAGAGARRVVAATPPCNRRAAGLRLPPSPWR